MAVLAVGGPPSYEWIAEADVVAVPTLGRERLRFQDGTEVELLRAEGLPRVILEARCVGRPVIATDVAGVREPWWARRPDSSSPEACLALS